MAKMAEMYSAQGEKWRAKAYAQAAAIIKTLDFEVTSSDQLRQRKGIGDRMAAHIDEILNTGRYAKRVAFENDPKTSALVRLTKIFGVGKAIALKLYRFGYTDIQSIRRGLEAHDHRLEFLNRNQRIGIKYYEDLEVRIKRGEIEAIRNLIRDAALRVYPKHVSHSLTIEAVGSYRRGKETCGDCDILLSLPTHPQQRVSLVPLIAHLLESGLIKETLSLPNASVVVDNDDEDVADGDKDSIFAPKRPQELVGKDALVSGKAERELESETFMGICLIPPGHEQYTGIYHRVDIKSYPYQAYPFALLYFTGSALFSRNMRHYANQRGWKLTDRGLYPLLNEFYTSTDHGIKCETERDIFRALGLEYREPKDRNYDEVTVIAEDDEVSTAKTKRLKDDDGSAKPGNVLKASEIEEEDESLPMIRVSREDELDEEQRRVNAERFEEWLKETRARFDPHRASSSSSSSLAMAKPEPAERDSMALFGSSEAPRSTFTAASSSFGEEASGDRIGGSAVEDINGRSSSSSLKAKLPDDDDGSSSEGLTAARHAASSVLHRKYNAAGRD